MMPARPLQIREIIEVNGSVKIQVNLGRGNQKTNTNTNESRSGDCLSCMDINNSEPVARITGYFDPSESRTRSTRAAGNLCFKSRLRTQVTVNSGCRSP